MPEHFKTVAFFLLFSAATVMSNAEGRSADEVITSLTPRINRGAPPASELAPVPLPQPPPTLPLGPPPVTGAALAHPAPVSPAVEEKQPLPTETSPATPPDGTASENAGQASPASEADNSATGSAETPVASPGAGQSDGEEHEESYRLDFGDRLKITFYDRDDISKEYRVGEGAIVSIPTIGTFRVASFTAQGLERHLTDVYERLTMRRIAVVVEVVERRPFFIVGLVSKPGPYPFQPGMSVLHAVAYAGGIYRGGSSGHLLTTDITRELSRLNQARDDLLRLHLRRARLIAERESEETIKAPDSLANLAKPDEISALIAQERLILRRRNATFERQTAGARTNVEAALRETTALEEQRKHIAEQMRATEARLAELKSLESRRLTSRQRVLEMETNLSNFYRQDKELSANIARAQRMAAAAEREESVLQLEHQMRIEEELGSIERQLSQLDVAYKTSSDLVEQLSGVPGNALTSTMEANVRYEVLRRSLGARTFISVNETDLLHPGDILRVAPAVVTR